MKRAAIWVGAGLLAASVGIHGSCRAKENATSASNGILGALAGAAVSTTELSGQRARGVQNININNNYTADTGSALSNGSLSGNAVIGNSATGMITTTGSINNNTGITTVFQNSGNNSLFQQTMSINITVH
jgi:hypothetical protein